MKSISFSLVRGGLVFRLERYLGLIGEDHLGIGRRVLVFWCITWVPIAILALFRWAHGGPGSQYSLITSEVGINVRLLFSGAVLIASEAFIETRVRVVTTQLEKRQMIIDDPDRYAGILSGAQRQIAGTTGLLGEAVLMLLSGLIAGFVARSGSFGPLRDWEAVAPGARIPAELAWYLGVAVPLVTFLLLRWIWRFSAWVRILWGISRLRLVLNASNPDLAGGIAFIGLAQEAFALLLLAISASAAAEVAFRVNSLGMPLRLFYLPVGALIAAEVFVLLAPMTFFVPRLIRLKRKGVVRYGALSTDYVNQFDYKWIQDHRDRNEALLGSSDIEQWANVGIGLERSQKMRPFPAFPSSIALIVLGGVLPFVPLAFLQMPAEEILRDALKLLI